METKNDYRKYIKYIIQNSYLGTFALNPYAEFFACYSEEDMSLEAFSRPLWAVAWMEKQDVPIGLISNCILEGTNQNSKRYWGEFSDYSQKMVEIPSIVITMYQFREELWDSFSDKERQQIYLWFLKSDNIKIPNNNWVFFRVLIHLFFHLLGVEESPVKTCKNELEIIESLYLGDGWYSDGINKQRDYYIAFAFHYYGLIYAHFAKESDPERCDIYTRRASLFANDYIAWFSKDGSTIPFGRSLIYRFAPVAFWCAMVWEHVPCNYSESVIKGIIFRNLRWWSEYSIINNGWMTLGYVYSNTIMTEEYNSNYSPYWCLKIGVLLAIPDEDEFWNIQEVDLPEIERIRYEKHSLAVICRDIDGKHVAMFANGQKSQHNFLNSVAKYGKYVYSNLFGFSVQRSFEKYSSGGYDCIAAVSLDNLTYFPCKSYDKAERHGECNYSCSYPIGEDKNVRVKTYVLPGIPWHIRIHQVCTKKEIYLCDGGYSVPVNSQYEENDQGLVNGNLISRAVSLSSNGEIDVCYTAPSTNILYPKTAFPVIRYHFYPGKYTIIDAFNGEYLTEKENILQVPSVQMKCGNKINILLNGITYKVYLEDYISIFMEKVSEVFGKSLRKLNMVRKKYIGT